MKISILIRTFYYYFIGICDTIFTSFRIILVKIFVWNKNRRYKIIFLELVADWAKRMVTHTGTKVDVEGMENICTGENYIILVNHQSNFDIYLVMGYLRIPICFVSKRYYFKIPFIGGLMREMGCVSISRGKAKSSLKSIEMTAQRIVEGKSIVIYPEGTRSTDGEIKPFKKGFIHIVDKVTLDSKILPVTLSGSKNIQTKGEFKINSSFVKIKISSPIIVKQGSIKTLDNKNNLLRKVENIIKKNYQKNISF